MFMKRYKINYDIHPSKLDLSSLEHNLEIIAKRCKTTESLTITTAVGSTSAYVTFFSKPRSAPNYSTSEANYDMELTMTLIHELISEIWMYWNKEWLDTID